MSPLVQGLDTDRMATEVAADLPEGTVVNLGIGLPVRVASRLPAGREVVFHSENGILGFGPPPTAGSEVPDLIDAAKHPVTLHPGGSVFSHADSFCMIRGGHLDVCVMGAFQVSAEGDLANWSSGAGVPGVGGAMDLAVGARSVWLMMRHATRDGAPKILPRCTLPLTALGVVQRIYTDLGVFVPSGDAVRAVALVDGVPLADVQELTGVRVDVDSDCRVLTP